MATPKEVRIDFSPSTKLEIFKRVNGRCSFPRCTNVTVGPFLGFDGAINMGVACHIYSAAEDGHVAGAGRRTHSLVAKKMVSGAVLLMHL